MPDRKFGVEIEHNQPVTADTVRKHLSTAFPSWGRVEHDGSGIEVISPVLEGDAGLGELSDVMEMLREMGGKVENADGLHIHHDAPEYTQVDDELATKRIVTIAQSWCNNQAIINELVLKHRRDDWFKCSLPGYAATSCYKQITQDYVDKLRDKVTVKNTLKASAKCNNMEDRFFALNMKALGVTGTIEVRQYQGTLNFDRARAWIRFGQCFIDTALQDDDTPIAPYAKIDTLMRDMGLDSFERGILMEVGR